MTPGTTSEKGEIAGRLPPRLVTVWCPDWPTVAAGAPGDRPAAVLRANRVVARTPAAAAAGVAVGDRRRVAQRACPELTLLEHDADRDAREFEPVVRAIADMAPRLEVVEPGWVCLAARGPSRYFGGDLAMAERLAELVVDATGARPGVGVADGRSASAIAARLAAGTSGTGTSSTVIVVPPGASPRFVAPLPVTWLGEIGEVTPGTIDLFVRLGLRTMGRLAALDPGDTLARFGAEGRHAHRLASGGDDRAAAAADPPPEWSVEHVFPEPVEQLETVVFVAKRLADALVDRLAGEGRVCVRLTVLVETEHGERSERSWYRAHGMSPGAMVERIRWHLEGWASTPGGPSGGVALVRLTPDEVRSDDGVQAGLWGGRSRADLDAARAIARLSAVAGEQAVSVPMWVGGRMPGDRYRRVPALSVDLDDTGRVDPGPEPWPGAIPTPSPAVVPAEPVPAELFDAAGEPIGVDGRGEPSGRPAQLVVGSTRRGIVAWAGPWPVEQRWWSPDRSRRLARFQVVTDDGVAHLVAVERQRWSVLATYS